MIAYSIDALKQTKYINQIYVVTSPNTPNTAAWVREHHPEITVLVTPGEGYVPDMITAVKQSNVKGPLLLIMSDLPLLTPTLLEEIIHTHEEKGTDALSVHLPLELCRKIGSRPDTLFHKDGKLIVPVGINIINADKIDVEQEDYNYILKDANPVLNVNTPEDYRICEELLRKKKDSEPHKCHPTSK
jgi:adenosylcobinamide-phosphate guanylyltransferase